MFLSVYLIVLCYLLDLYFLFWYVNVNSKKEIYVQQSTHKEKQLICCEHYLITKLQKITWFLNFYVRFHRLKS